MIQADLTVVGISELATPIGTRARVAAGVGRRGEIGQAVICNGRPGRVEPSGGQAIARGEDAEQGERDEERRSTHDSG